MNKFWSICKNTFTQTIRQPIFGVLILLTFALLVIDLPLSQWTLGSDYEISDQQLLESLGLGTLLLSSLLVAAFSAAAALSHEIEDKTALTVISKPVPRAVFVLGKFAGVAAAVALAYYLCSLVLLMTVRHHAMSSASSPYDMPVIVLGLAALGLAIGIALVGNYFFGWSFISAGVWSALATMSAAMLVIGFVGKEWVIVPFGQDIDPPVVQGIVLLFFAAIMLCAIAVAASTRLGEIMTLLVCVGILFLGSMPVFLFGQPTRLALIEILAPLLKVSDPGQIPLLDLLGAISPRFTYFYPLYDMAVEKQIPASFIALAGGYCALYSAGAMAVGIALFQRRQIQASEGGSTGGVVAVIAWLGRAGAIAAALVGLALLSLVMVLNTAGLVTAGTLLLLAVLGWLFWGYFAAGHRWTHRLVIAGAVLWLLGGLGVLLQMNWPLLPRGNALQATIHLAVAGLLLLTLLLPATRRHFSNL